MNFIHSRNPTLNSSGNSITL